MMIIGQKQKSTSRGAVKEKEILDKRAKMREGAYIEETMLEIERGDRKQGEKQKAGNKALVSLSIFFQGVRNTLFRLCKWMKISICVKIKQEKELMCV